MSLNYFTRHHQRLDRIGQGAARNEAQRHEKRGRADSLPMHFSTQATRRYRIVDLDVRLARRIKVGNRARAYANGTQIYLIHDSSSLL
jgi:hypothetical protein